MGGGPAFWAPVAFGASIGLCQGQEVLALYLFAVWLQAIDLTSR